VERDGDGEPAHLGACALEAYEIHMGRTHGVISGDANPAPFSMQFESTEAGDGACSPDGLVVGTYMHGLLENASLRRAMLRRLTARKGMTLPNAPAVATVDAAIDTLADAVRDHLDMDAIGAMIGLSAMSAT
jgi:adenosylcobyric acid synthase